MTSPSALNLLPADAVLADLAELKSLVLRLAEPADETAPAFLPLAKLARHFGISRSLANRIVTAAASAGQLEILRPTLNGTKGYQLYSVSDFKLYLSTEK